MKAKINLLLLVLIVSLSSFSQVTDSTYYKRLFYVCKAWGHVKYYHPNVAAGNVDWDLELLQFIPKVRNTIENAAFNDSLLVFLDKAGAITINNQELPNFPDSLNNNLDYSWFQNAIFSDSVRARLDTIRSRFRPQDNVYLSVAYTNGNPTFENDIACNSFPPSESLRLLSIFRYWNVINYFYPYKNIMDQDWDTTLIEFFPKIIEAQYNQDFHFAFKEFSTRIDDSHSYFYSSVYDSYVGYSKPPFQVRYIENETVITKVKAGITEIKVGDIIKELDGINIYHLRDSLRKYAHGSNEVIIERELNNIIISGATLSTLSISVDDGVSIHTESFERMPYNLDTDQPIWRDTTIYENCKFGIVDMGRLEIADISSMFNDLWDTDVIIFDIRNYPNATLWTLVNYLYPSSIHIANFTKPDISYPGRLEWMEENIGYGTSNTYPGQIIILFDERTQSQAEYTVMGLEQFPGALKIGSTTSAADGNVAKVYLPYNIEIMATFLGTFYPDFTPTQRVGIIPDIEVHPTILGIREGKDEVLEYALNCDFVNIDYNSMINNNKFYPNPTKGQIKYEMSKEKPAFIEIIDVQGRVLRQIQIENLSGDINISTLKNGIYYFKTYYQSGQTTVELIFKD